MTIRKDLYACHVHGRQGGDSYSEGKFTTVYRAFKAATKTTTEDAVICYYNQEGEFSVIYKSDMYPYSPSQTMRFLDGNLDKVKGRM